MQKEQDKGPPGKARNFLGERRKRPVLFLATVALVVVLDQVSKLWVRNNLPQIELLPGFLDLIYVENSGSAFGLLSDQTFFLITVSIASLIIILLIFYYLAPSTTLGIVSLGLILSGAIGNLIDRLRFGYVTDFIDIHIKNIFHWPAFNIADAAIVIGVFTFIYSLYRSGLLKKGSYEEKHRHGARD